MSRAAEISIDEPLLDAVQRIARGDEHPEPLPRHRHHLPRAQVETTQKARIVLATAEVVTEKSYTKTTSRDIIKAAGVSSKTFYAHFDGKEQAFLAAYTLLDSTMLALARAPLDMARPRTDLREHVEAWLSALAAWPLLARMRFIEGRAAGVQADRHRHEMAKSVVAAFGAGLDEARTHDPRIVRPSDGVLALLYGGITDQLTRWVTERDPAELVQLAPAIVEAIERLCFLEPPAYADGE
ncbi:MAG: helix-turn-helix domain-containing protein [Solirubrobacteraceae bacterium]|nr:helix-turn-helix domain-containing protein [Solirubrobacteraceae bacterium]